MDNIWQPKKSLKDNCRMVVNAIEKAFEPDLVVKVNKDSIITGIKAVTILGAKFLLKHPILKMNIDSIRFYNLTVETEFQDEEN